jgi:hypothetical protein
MAHKTAMVLTLEHKVMDSAIMTVSVIKQVRNLGARADCARWSGMNDQ